MKKILAFFLFFLLSLPLAAAQGAEPSSPFPAALTFAFGTVFGAVVLFFFLDYFLMDIKIDRKFISNSVMVLVGLIVAVSMISESLYSVPDHPLYQPRYGNGICDDMELYIYPRDCNLVCGDGFCNTNPPFAEWTSCPQDCISNITEFNYNLTTSYGNHTASLWNYTRPLVAGLGITNDSFVCSLGTILNINGSNYGITAGHCFSNGDSVYQPYSYFIGNVTFKKYSFPFILDYGIITLNVTSSSTDFLNNTVDCIASKLSDVNTTNRVYKIGERTGLTFGRIQEVGDRLLITGENGSQFCDSGDSGSGIVLLTKPRILIGLVTEKIGNGTICGSPRPQDIIANYTYMTGNNLPVCPTSPIPQPDGE